MTFTATEARQNLFRLLRKSVKGHVPVKITSKEGNVVMISEEDLELLSVPGMRNCMREAKADIRAGRTKSLKDIFG
jgi:antitoxin YefM